MSSKVRIACRRCRTKRIKCDGGIPACSNCQKANEACIDVDGRNKTLSIPRDFAANARARIEWLEEHIKLLAPDFNLEDGPRVDFSFLEATGNAPSPSILVHTQSSNFSMPEAQSMSTKRTYSTLIQQPPEEGFPDEARSVALDLGLLTLNSDSRQTHYLGTSSGRLFTSLIGAGSPETPLSVRGCKIPRFSPFSSPSDTKPLAHGRKSKEVCKNLYDLLRKNLPSEEDTQVLLEAYFRHIHVDHPFMHPTSLISIVEALYRCAASDVSTTIGYNGWPGDIDSFSYNGEFGMLRNNRCTPLSAFTATFHVFMVFTLAATVRTRQRIYDFAPNQFYRVAITAGQHCFSDTSLASLQSTLLLAVYSLLGPAEMNIWTLTYVAMAHCIDLGLHRTPSAGSGVTPQALFMRKMVFFSVYHLDRSIAAIQGRPLGIRDETFDLELPSLADAEDNAKSIGDHDFVTRMSFTNGLPFSIHRFKLDPIISEIKLLFYHLPSQINAYAWPHDRHAAQLAIQRKLEDWRHGLSNIAGAFQGESDDDRLEHRKYGLKLTSQYFATMILLYQPSQNIPQPSEQALLICYQCAASRLNTYNDLYYAESFYQSFRSVQGIFSSGATMIYCLWTSNLVRKSITPSEAMRDLRTCTNLLSVGGEWWPSVKKGKESFVRAMDALLKSLENTSQANFSRDEQPPAQRRHILPRLRDDDTFTLPTTGMEADTIERDIQPAFSSVTHDPVQVSHMQSDFSTTDWTILGDPAFHHDTHSMLEPYPEDGADSTVEAFIAEFLKNDTAWNPF